MASQKRLYRSRKDRILAGVCGGLGEYFGIDPVWVRVIFVLLALADGVGVVLYLLLWIIVPQAPLAPGEVEVPVEGRPSPQESFRQAAEEMRERIEKAAQTIQQKTRSSDILLGVVLIVLGILLLLRNLHIWWVDFGVIWPVLLIIAGFYLLLRK